jgi:hypothetical protein
LLGGVRWLDKWRLDLSGVLGEERVLNRWEKLESSTTALLNYESTAELLLETKTWIF